MSNYYNEWEPYAADWLRNLIKKGLIPDGEVDTRSIVDVRPNDLRGFTQAHFFAGVAGWSLALKIAKWPTDRQIWTGSCPCQPFSCAGKGKGVDDERHLWPHFFRLIRSCRPETIVGEQVAGAAGYGWLDGVRSDLESEEYTIEAVDIPACAVNAPHIRQRLYWVAANMGNAISEGLEGYTWHGDGSDQSRRIETYENGSVAETSSRDMADTMRTEWGTETEEWHVYDGDDTRRQEAPSGYQLHSSTNNMANAESWGHSRQNEQTRIFSRSIERGEGYWHNAIWLTGADGKTRRAPGSPQSRLCSVDDGISSGMDGLCPSIPLLTTKAEARATKLKALGNAIVPQLAAEFIKAIK
jgi:DNA (cytosine-5)-methyltransferase 1